MPYRYNLIFLEKDLEIGKDDVKIIADCIGYNRDYMLGILKHLELSSHLFATKIKLDYPRRRKKPDVIVEFDGHFRPFRMLSTSEQVLVILDIVLSHAKDLSAFQPVVLLVDWRTLHHLQKYNMAKVVGFLRSTQTSFQSIIVSPHAYRELDWEGWTMAEFRIEDKGLTVDQSALRS